MPREELHPPTGLSARPRSLYVHIPFCVSKCLYCAFNSKAGWREADLDRYLEALLRELSLLEEGEPLDLETIYLGGGTPTVLGAQRLAKLSSSLCARLAPGVLREWTVEANPGTVTDDLLELLASFPVTRISMGVQTFDRERLRRMGRTHRPEDVEETVARLRSLPHLSLNLDLIYGLPEQTLSAWRQDLERLLDLEPDHISLYELQYEGGTPFEQARDRGELRELDEDLILRMQDEALRLLRDAGYEMYEISNYARKGEESLHNLNYWRNDPYYGIGAGAFARVGSERTRRENDPRAYVGAIMESGQAVVERDHLGPLEDYVETLSSGLRTATGVDLRDLRRRTGMDASMLHAHRLRSLQDEGLALVEGTRLKLTLGGLRVLDTVLRGLLDDLQPATRPG